MAASALKRLLLSPKSLLSSSSASRLFYTTAGKPWPPAGFDTSLPPPLFRPFPQPSFAYETEEALHVREDMPGVEKEGVEVIVKPYLLLLKGERKIAKESGDPDGVFVYGYYYNICEKKYHLSQVKASLRNGVLTAVIPKVKGYVCDTPSCIGRRSDLDYDGGGAIWGGGTSFGLVLSVGWKAPSEGRFKLNTDGASKGNPGKAGVGGLIRDHKGEWVGGFCQSIGIQSSLEAELRGLRSGLRLARDLNITNLEVEMDAKSAIQLVTGNSDIPRDLWDIVLDCRQLMAQLRVASLKHVYREANACADVLANFGVVSNGYVVYKAAPYWVTRQMKEDARGVEYPRTMKNTGGGRGFLRKCTQQRQMGLQAVF
ncbi:hypothetical protein Vadar_023977 [Vaccinium darrowii]|uniref:Uncharacterized protein n=1 Tax=Vaccinium darrowii TaxID=229202 RepID=A0ACB7XJY7_9ERIC|nr:hypothetical protein Vadar_023977 [Vaccinium darrowii]